MYEFHQEKKKINAKYYFNATLCLNIHYASDGKLVSV